MPERYQGSSQPEPIAFRWTPSWNESRGRSPSVLGPFVVHIQFFEFSETESSFPMLSPKKYPEKKYPDQDEWLFERVKEHRRQHCRNYEYLREAVLYGGMQATGEPLGVGIGEDIVQVALTRSREEAGPESSHVGVLLPVEAFQEGWERKPFLSLKPEVMNAFDQVDARLLELDLNRMNDEMEWESPLTRFSAEKLLALIPQSLLKSPSMYGKFARWQVNRKKFGQGYRVEGSDQRPVPVDLHLTLDVDQPVSDAARQFPGGPEERWERLAEEIGGPEWVEHFRVEVLDWQGRRYADPDGRELLCLDIDKWLKTWDAPGGWQCSVAAFQIDWSKPDTALKALFSAWLKKHRPHAPDSGTGKGSRAEKIAMDLLALAYQRLYRRFRVEKGERDENTFIKEFGRETDKWPKYVTRLQRSQIINYLSNAKKILREEFNCRRIDLGKPKELCREDFL